MSKFSSMVTAQLNAYVYALADPRKDGTLKDRIFYIGKGNGNRCHNHAQVERGLDDLPLHEAEHKLSVIRDIHSTGREVEVHIVSHGIMDQEAHDLEAVLIPILGDTNKFAGHSDRHLWLTTNQIDERYERPVQRRDVALFCGNLLFVSLNRQDTNSLLQEGAEAGMAQATLGDWNLSESRSRCVDVVIGVKNGLIVSIFETLKSAEGQTRFDRFAPTTKGAHGRSRFLALRSCDLETELLSRSVYVGDKMLSKIRPGAGCQFFGAMDEHL